MGKRAKRWPWGLVAWGLILLSLVDSAGARRGPVLQVKPEDYDFGTVGRLQGKVQATFVLRNRGDAPLIIQGVKTS